MAMVLCTGIDPLLLETRKMILERAGHTVSSANEQAMVIAACKQRSFDVAVNRTIGFAKQQEIHGFCDPSTLSQG